MTIRYPYAVNDSTLIDHVPELGSGDFECLAEIASVLDRHGKLERFDIALRHRHFDLDESEMMIETCDVAGRTLSIQPFAVDDIPDGATVRETTWSLALDGPKASQRCRQGCFVDLKDNHLTRHVYRRP